MIVIKAKTVHELPIKNDRTIFFNDEGGFIRFRHKPTKLLDRIFIPNSKGECLLYMAETRQGMKAYECAILCANGTRILPRARTFYEVGI